MRPDAQDPRERTEPTPGDDGSLADLEAGDEAVRGGVKWELSELDAVRTPLPKPDGIGTKYTLPQG